MIQPVFLTRRFNRYAFFSDICRASGLGFIVWSATLTDILLLILGVCLLAYGLGLDRSVKDASDANRIHH